MPLKLARSVRYSRSSAFSLIELITVMSVIGILMAMSSITINSLRAPSLSAGTRQIADVFSYARSQAIAKRTIVRCAFVVSGGESSEAPYRRFSLWHWDKSAKDFVQMTSWKTITQGVYIEPALPNYIRGADYAEHDRSSVRGDYILSKEGGEFESTIGNEPVTLRFFEFTPSGRARLSRGSERNLVAVLRLGQPEDLLEAENWAQINVDTLTGRVRIYRP